MKRFFLTAVFTTALASLATDSIAASNQSSTQPVKLDGLEIDLEARRVTLDAEVCLRTGLLEFLLCKAGTKEHESILRTNTSAADLHAAMLAVGLTPGKPARWASEGPKAELLPPQGPAVSVTLNWQDSAGMKHSTPAGRWLLRATTDKPRTVKQWIFVGSDILPDGSYWADVEGGIVSVTNFDSAVFDVPEISSSSDELLEFAADTAAIPPLGTKVQVTFEPLPSAERAEQLLGQIIQNIRHMDVAKAMWRSFADKLRKLLKRRAIAICPPSCQPNQQDCNTND